MVLYGSVYLNFFTCIWMVWGLDWKRIGIMPFTLQEKYNMNLMRPKKCSIWLEFYPQNAPIRSSENLISKFFEWNIDFIGKLGIWTKLEIFRGKIWERCVLWISIGQGEISVFVTLEIWDFINKSRIYVKCWDFIFVSKICDCVVCF